MVRTCVGCGGKFTKSELIRYVWCDSGPVPDPAQRALGRGAYCCKQKKCSDRFLKKRKIWRRVFRLSSDL
ncbi:MAG: YlxR family protein [Desulfofustis sp.]|nr:YlxR family protein [Desulfofustis sp.]